MFLFELFTLVQLFNVTYLVFQCMYLIKVFLSVNCPNLVFKNYNNLLNL